MVLGEKTDSGVHSMTPHMVEGAQAAETVSHGDAGPVSQGSRRGWQPPFSGRMADLYVPVPGVTLGPGVVQQIEQSDSALCPPPQRGPSPWLTGPPELRAAGHGNPPLELGQLMMAWEAPVSSAKIEEGRSKLGVYDPSRSAAGTTGVGLGVGTEVSRLPLFVRDQLGDRGGSSELALVWGKGPPGCQSGWSFILSAVFGVT